MIKVIFYWSFCYFLINVLETTTLLNELIIDLFSICVKIFKYQFITKGLFMRQWISSFDCKLSLDWRTFLNFWNYLFFNLFVLNNKVVLIYFDLSWYFIIDKQMNSFKNRLIYWRWKTIWKKKWKFIQILILRFK